MVVCHEPEITQEIRLANDYYIPELRKIFECLDYTMQFARLIQARAVNYQSFASGCLPV